MAIECYLSDYESDDSPIWRFQYVPREIKTSYQVNYQPIDIPGSTVLPLQFKNLSDQSRTFTDILLDGFWHKKTVAPLIDGFNKLVEISSYYSPKVLAFVYGDDISFSPCVISGQVSFVERLHLNGQPGRVKLSFTLTKVPIEQVVNENVVVSGSTNLGLTGSSGG